MASKSYSLNGMMRGSAPPLFPGIELEVVRITTPNRRLFYLCSDKPWGAYYHWSGCSLECTQPNPCALHDRSVPLKWRGYVHALEQHGVAQREVIIELTQTALVMLDLQLCGQPVRGTMVNIAKTKGGKHGRFVVEVVPRRIDAATLCDERDPEPVLRKLWLHNAKVLAEKPKG